MDQNLFYKMKYLALFALLLLCSCSASNKLKTVPESQTVVSMAGVLHATELSADQPLQSTGATAGFSGDNTSTVEEMTPGPKATVIDKKQVTKKAHSFSQMKEMVQNGDIVMTRSDKKTLDRLENFYKGDFKDLKNLKVEPFELTTAAKIIGGVGIIALIIALFGSFFFAFIFLLAVTAFILRWIGVIAF